MPINHARFVVNGGGSGRCTMPITRVEITFIGQSSSDYLLKLEGKFESVSYFRNFSV